MLQKTSICWIALLAAPVCLPVVAGQAPPPINVTAIVYDRDAAGTLLLMRSDNPSAGEATYITTATNRAGSNGVTNYMWLNGGWRLYIGNQTARTIWLTLSGQGISLPDGYYSANVEVYANCFDTSGTVVPFVDILPGAPNNNCVLGVDFSTGGTKYKLEMGQPFSGPATGSATVTCNQTDTTGTACNWWTITPFNSAANLYKFATKGLSFIGPYHNTYRIDVRNP